MQCNELSLAKHFFTQNAKLEKTKRGPGSFTGHIIYIDLEPDGPPFINGCFKWIIWNLYHGKMGWKSPNIHFIYLEPKWHLFWLEKALFCGGLTFKNEVTGGSRYILYIYLPHPSSENGSMNISQFLATKTWTWPTRLTNMFLPFQFCINRGQLEAKQFNKWMEVLVISNHFLNQD